ncbi:MAG: glycosyltransferase family 2 protein, partial [Candidatus Binatia bacterium]
MQRIRHPQKLGDRIGAPDAHDASFVALFEGWPDDLGRLHASLERHLGPRSWELVVVDLPGDDEASERIASLERVTHVPLRDPMGWAAARNLGLRLASGRVVVVVDGSVELTGDAVTALDAHLSDPAVGLVGRWGVVTNDGFDFEEVSPAAVVDVDGVEAYVMAMRRADLARTGLFDVKYKWYRNADIDFSFQVRDAGLRTIVDPALPFDRHEHRSWA